MIARDHPRLSLSRQCRLVSISHTSLYYTPKSESNEALALMRRIDELYLKHPFYGSRQMVRHLRREGVRVGRYRVRRQMDLQAIYQAPRTSAPHPEHRIYPYLLKGLSITCPNHVWCADITPAFAGAGYTSMFSVASSTLWRSWTGRPVGCWRGGCRTPWTWTSASPY